MGYDLHITRRKDWAADAAPAISVEEWHEYVRSDPELRLDEEELGPHTAVWLGPSEHEVPWLAWAGGNISSKYPDAALTRKMVAIASALGATVQGDEGETYDERGEAVLQSPPTFVEQVKRWWRNLRSPGAAPMEPAQVPFKVGDRVRDVFGSRNEGTVTKIDLTAEHGAGLITVEYDDGRVLHSAAFAHGLEAVQLRMDA